MDKFKSVAGVGILALLVAGTTTVVICSVNAQTNVAKAGTQLPAFSGYATPEAALKSFIWSESSGNLDKTPAACTPDQAERMKAKTTGKSEEEIKRLMVQEAKNRANYDITQKEIISDDEVRLHLRVQPYPGHPGIGNDVQVMQKIGGEWKYAGKYGVDK